MLFAVAYFGLDGLKCLSILACLLILMGVAARRKRKIHVPLMLSAFAIDLGIVLYIELNRGAIAAAKAKMGPLMMVHIAISVIVLILYGLQIWTGIQNLKGRRSWWHGWTGMSFVVFRLGNLVTSFMVMK